MKERKTITIEKDVWDDLIVLRGLTSQPSLSQTIRLAMNRAGYNRAFFKRIVALLQEGEKQ